MAAGREERLGEPVVPVVLDVRPPDEAFDAFFAAEYPGMVRLAFLMLRSEEAVEEAAQDAFAQLLERWHRVDNKGGYVRTVVVNRCRDLQRRRTRAERSLRLVGRREAPELEYDHLLSALQALPPRRRAAIVLRYYDDCTIDEVATILGVRPGTARSTIHRGLEQLRGVIER